MNLTKECDCMKKLLALVLALVCVLTLFGCSADNNSKPVVMNGIYAEVTELIDNGICEVVVTGKDSNFDIGDTLVIHYNTIRGNSDEVEKQLEVGDTIVVTYEKHEEKDGSIHIAVEYVDLKPTE